MTNMTCSLLPSSKSSDVSKSREKTEKNKGTMGKRLRKESQDRIEVIDMNQVTEKQNSFNWEGEWDINIEG